MTNFESSKDKYGYFPLLATDNYISIYKNALLFTEGDIGENVFSLLFNLCLESQICLQKFFECDFIKPALNRFRTSLTNFNELLEGLHFFSVMAQNVERFSLVQKESFNTIFDSLLKEGDNPDIIAFSVTGLYFLLHCDNSVENNAVDVFLKMNTITKLLNINYDQLEDKSLKVCLHVIIIINTIIEKLSIESLFSFLISNNILNVFESFLIKNCLIIFKKEILYGLQKITFHSNEHLSLSVIKHNIFNSVVSYLQNSDFLIRKLSVGIIVNCLLLNNFDITSEIHNHQAEEIIVTKVLPNETDKELIFSCLQSILYFVQCGNILNDKNPFALHLKKIGIEDWIGKNQNYVQEHLEIIEKIKKYLN